LLSPKYTLAGNFEIVFSSHRTQCTQCGARHGIAKILQYAGIDVSDGDYFHCHACGTTHTPKNDGSLRKGGRYFRAPYNDSVFHHKSLSHIPSQQPSTSNFAGVQQQYIPEHLVRQSLHYTETNAFAQYLIQVFGENMRSHLALWHLGGDAWHGTVFHYLDAEGRHINAKSVLYDDTAKRIKTGFQLNFSQTASHDDIKEYPFVFGMRTAFNQQIGYSQFTFFTRKRGYGQCLYGLWHLPKKPDALVLLCESEKTAIIGSFMMPEFCWIATGGTNGLSAEKTPALAERRVLICFDSDEAGISKTQTALKILGLCDIEAVGEINGVPLPVHLFGAATHDGYDLADYFLEEQRRNNADVAREIRQQQDNHAEKSEESEESTLWRQCFQDRETLPVRDLIHRAAALESHSFTNNLANNFTNNLTNEQLSAHVQTYWLNRIHNAVYKGILRETTPHVFALQPAVTSAIASAPTTEGRAM
jgi:hypothetical protein